MLYILTGKINHNKHSMDARGAALHYWISERGIHDLGWPQLYL